MDGDHGEAHSLGWASSPTCRKTRADVVGGRSDGRAYKSIRIGGNGRPAMVSQLKPTLLSKFQIRVPWSSGGRTALIMGKDAGKEFDENPSKRP